MSAATQNEMERLRAERDALQRLADCRAKERDALAAQLDRPRIKILGDLLKAGIEPENIFTSLARLKAEWQAEALVDFGHLYGPESTVRMLTQREAAKLRHQASEPTHD